MEESIVYVHVDGKARIVEVQSSEFVHDPAGWTEIDRGSGTRYAHAQGHYFPLPIMTEDGAYRYKLENGTAMERTAEEMAADIADQPDPDEPAPGEYDVWDALDAAYREGVDSAYEQQG